MSRYLFILLLFPSLFFVACGDRLPTGPDPDYVESYDTTLTDNSFLLVGAGYNNMRVDLSGGLNQGWSVQEVLNTITVVETDYVNLPGKSGVNMTVVLKFLDQRGTVSWENLFEKESDSATIYAAISIGGKKYVSIDGSTEVLFTRNTFGEIIGKYSGRLAGPFGDTISVSDGRFSVQSGQ